jgi:hypothetical protein
MTIIQQPDAYSLTSTIKDFIIDSTEDITFEALLSGQSILLETYSPDASGRIQVRDLGKFLENYLSGYFDVSVQSEISRVFTFKINTTQINVTVLRCKSFFAKSVDRFFLSRFLNLQYLKKITVPGTKEQVTALLNPTNSTIKVKVIYKQNGLPTDSAIVTLATHNDSKFYTVDVSFNTICKLFGAIERKAIISYIIYFADITIQYLVDWETYLDAKSFVYLNAFGVPESLVCRGETYRKGVSSFGSAKIHGIEHKYDVKRADTFEVSSGKIYSQTDYLFFREMFSSEEVKVFFAGEYRKIIITEENMNVNSRSGSLDPVKFTFRFADPVENSILQDNFAWVLEDGTWNDKGLWLDTGHWNDE